MRTLKDFDDLGAPRLSLVAAEAENNIEEPLHIAASVLRVEVVFEHLKVTADILQFQLTILAVCVYLAPHLLDHCGVG